MVRISDTMKQQNDLDTFPVAYGADIWLDKNKGEDPANYKSLQAMYNDDELGGGGSIQLETMPTASADYVGKIVQYVGESGTYQKGHFYECILAHNGAESIYAWEDVDHLRFNHVVYHCTVPPVNEECKPGDIIYYSGKTMGNFKNGYYYRAIPNATPQQHYGATFWTTPSLGTGYLCYTPFELRIGFIVYPTGTGGTSYPYEITDFDDTGITITPYGWSGEDRHYVGVYYTETVEGWEELEGGGGTSIFYGTMDEWNALSTDAKKQYDYMADSQSGNENTFWSGFTTIDEDTHVATTTDYDFEVTLPSDGYYCATIDLSIGKQKVIVFIDDGLGTYYTFKTFIAQEERILERYRLPYLPAGRTVRIRHAGINGEASGQATLKLQRVDFS